MLASYDNNATPMSIKEFAIYAGGRIGQYYAKDNSTAYELTDHLGNVRALIKRTKKTDGTADVIDYNDYFPFGGIARGTNSFHYKYSYQGQYAERDEETGWNSFELRMYDSKIGRWLSTDPYGEFWSPYVGMGNNPVNRMDPTGGFTGTPGSALQASANAFVDRIGSQILERAIIAGGKSSLLPAVGVTASRQVSSSLSAMSALPTSRSLSQFTKAYKAWLAIKSTLSLFDQFVGNAGGGFVYYSSDPTSRDVFKLGRPHTRAVDVIEDPLAMLKYPGKSPANIFDRVKDAADGVDAAQRLYENVFKEPALKPAPPDTFRGTFTDKNGSKANYRIVTRGKDTLDQKFYTPDGY